MNGEVRWLLAAWGILVLAWLYPNDVIDQMLAVAGWSCWLMSFDARPSQ